MCEPKGETRVHLNLELNSRESMAALESTAASLEPIWLSFVRPQMVLFKSGHSLSFCLSCLSSARYHSGCRTSTELAALLDAFDDHKGQRSTLSHLSFISRSSSSRVSSSFVLHYQGTDTGVKLGKKESEWQLEGGVPIGESEREQAKCDFKLCNQIVSIS